MLIIIFGDIGAGKTTLAETLAPALGFSLIQFDRLALSVTKKERMYSDSGLFLLSDSEIENVHAYMRDKARNLLSFGKKVILESMFFKKEREQAILLAEKMQIPYRLIYVHCSAEETKERLHKRFTKDKQTANVSLFIENKELLDDEEREHITIDTTGKSAEKCVSEVMEKLALP